jgi:Co/Zn/Cd efflux system component
LHALSSAQAARREKTLLAALLLSMWAPLTTGLAVLLSNSTTQLADFIRRTVELAALFISWLVFRRLRREPAATPEATARLERLAAFSVAAALVGSGVAMLALALSRIHSFEPGGNVYPGLVIATLGLITNTWFWWRYRAFDREQNSPIIGAQRRLYSAKALVDLCVIAALTMVALDPLHPCTRPVDVSGSVAIAIYLLWSGVRTLRSAPAGRSATISPL